MDGNTSYGSPCHKGNFALFGIGEHHLEIGGISRGVAYFPGDVIIDLTGKETPVLTTLMVGSNIFTKFLPKVKTNVYGWLSLPFKDFGVPDLTNADWNALYADINTLLKGGHSVVAFCQGGHGRTGMFASILGYKFFKGEGGWDNPVKKLRSIYCAEAVDTIEQEKYVYATLGLEFPKDTGRKPSFTMPARDPNINYEWQSGYVWVAGKGYVPKGEASAAAPTSAELIPAAKYSTSKASSSPVVELCPVCRNVSSSYVVTHGLCVNCSDQAVKEITAIAQQQGILTSEVSLLDEDGMCRCGEPSCVGIYKATCGHVVHGDITDSAGKCGSCHNESIHDYANDDDFYGKVYLG